jgi:hypothetical protein
MVARFVVTAMDSSFGAMESFREPLTEFTVAVMETEPLATALSTPDELTVASPKLDELQVTELVRSFVVLSL